MGFIKQYVNPVFVYLKEGAGEPWAGQVRLKADACLQARFSVATEANLGVEPPTGSAKLTPSTSIWFNS